VTIKGWNWKKNFDTPHDRHPPYILRRLIPPLIRTPPKRPRNLLASAFPQDARGEILEGGILLRPITLL